MPSGIGAAAEAAKRPSGKTATIARVLMAARQEFAANGIAGAHMDSIARSAGVTKQLLYHYYGGKDDLFAAVLDETAADVLPKLLALDFEHLAPIEALAAFADQVFEQYRTDPLLGHLAREGLRFHNQRAELQSRFVRVTPALTEKLQRIIDRGVAAGAFRSGLDARSCLACLSLMMPGGITNNYTMSAILGVDTTSPEGMDLWRTTARAFVLQALASPAIHLADPAATRAACREQDAEPLS